MLAIVSGHLLSQSSLAGVEGTNHILAMLLGSGVRIGVNVFLLLGVWFMVDAKFKATFSWHGYTLYVNLTCRR